MEDLTLITQARQEAERQIIDAFRRNTPKLTKTTTGAVKVEQLGQLAYYAASVVNKAVSTARSR